MEARGRDVSYLTIVTEPVPMVDDLFGGGGLCEGRDGGETSSKLHEAVIGVHGRGGTGGMLASLGLRRLFMLSSASVSFCRAKKESKAAHSSSSSAFIQSSCSGP